MSDKVKFITSIYSDLYGTEYGGRIGRGGHYRYSLLSLLKMSDADFLCYTSDRELPSLITFFYETHGISSDKLKFQVFDIANTKFKDLINQYKDVEATKKSDRCIEVQYSKFHWWWNEDKSYDYYYWIDAGLSHCGLIPVKYLVGTHPEQRYYESTLFNNDFFVSWSVYTFLLVPNPIPPPKSCIFLTPKLDVIMIKQFLKLIFLPKLSVIYPSSKSCKSAEKISL